MTAETHTAARNGTDRAIADGSSAERDPAQSGRTANFNRLAGLYRWMEYASFGPWLWWCRCAFLDELGECRRAVVLGDGDGRFTARLLTANPQIAIEAVDVSDAMLRSLLRRAGAHSGRVRAVCADARAWQPRTASYAEPCDLIVTHFFLDCLTTSEVEALAAKMREVAQPEARWVVSEFAEPEGLFGRALARPVVWLLYQAFGLLTGLAVRTLPDYDAALRAAGFAPVKRQRLLGGLLVSELWTRSE